MSTTRNIFCDIVQRLCSTLVLQFMHITTGRKMPGSQERIEGPTSPAVHSDEGPSAILAETGLMVKEVFEQSDP